MPTSGEIARSSGEMAQSSNLQTPHVPMRSVPTAHGLEEPIAFLETQIDDLNPQAIGYVYDRLFEAGAVDVFTQAIGMKKSRPGILLSVVCHPAQIEACETVLFRETTTLGIRRSMQQRSILRREIQTINIEYGTVRVKIARSQVGGAIVNVQPEYEDCAEIARQTGLPWREIHRLALESWWQHQDCSPRNQIRVKA
jgi:pyridinium-3,5-bisthiocarboxylic acid mononucleotide nickel chelatase